MNSITKEGFFVDNVMQPTMNMIQKEEQQAEMEATQPYRCHSPGNTAPAVLARRFRNPKRTTEKRVLAIGGDHLARQKVPLKTALFAKSKTSKRRKSTQPSKRYQTIRNKDLHDI